MPVNIVGSIVNKFSAGTADFTFTPQEPYAAKVWRIFATGVSANDNWVLTNNGREVARFRLQTVGNQNLLGNSDASTPKVFDFMSYMAEVLGRPFSYPVMQGGTLELKSVGGATADVLIQYEECAPAELNPNDINHPQSNHFIVPFYAYRNASVTASAEVDFDTEVKPSWMPSLFIETALVAGWDMTILALFAEGAGVNTFSGSADHQSVTDHLYLIRGGQRMFNRDTTEGLALLGVASAAGSANTVYGSRLSTLRAFQLQRPEQVDMFDTPLQVRTGEAWEWGLGFNSGSFTGGADYSKAMTVAIVDVYQRAS